MKKEKRLVLNKKIIANLDHVDMSRIKGGLPPIIIIKPPRSNQSCGCGGTSACTV